MVQKQCSGTVDYGRWEHDDQVRILTGICRGRPVQKDHVCWTAIPPYKLILIPIVETILRNDYCVRAGEGKGTSSDMGKRVG